MQYVLSARFGSSDVGIYIDWNSHMHTLPSPIIMHAQAQLRLVFMLASGKDKGGSCQSIIVIRHGERMDVVNYEWKKTAARPYDTPLSERGVEQVREVVKEKVRALSACWSS